MASLTVPHFDVLSDEFALVFSELLQPVMSSMDAAKMAALLK
ncbi:MAG: hypothetical protein ABI255_03285 [Microbacteriaceae bacterium]